jgi:antirestriction protein ArdC
VHRISTNKEGHKTTTTSDRSELLDSLTEGISKLTTSDEWQRYLDCQSRFYHYSSNNVMLILTQRHEATQIAGFNAWKRLGRFVQKGEKAIWIIAPMRYKVADDEKNDEKHQVIRGFKWVPVFDISSTDGEELPTVCNKLAGDDPDGLFDRLTAVADSIGFHVENVELDGHVNGDCTYSEKRIRVEVTNAPAQRIKTLAHELAHALLHENFKDRALAELEAESTAFVVLKALGIDSSDYSFGYVANWAGGGEQAIAGITASCQNIQKAAVTILGHFEVGDQEVAA